MVQNYKILGETNHVAKERNIDLIVMGSHGTGGLSNILMGSDTEKVVRTADGRSGLAHLFKGNIGQEIMSSCP